MRSSRCKEMQRKAAKDEMQEKDERNETDETDEKNKKGGRQQQYCKRSCNS